MARLARTVEDVLLGEGVHGTEEERFADFLGIASVIHNRAALHGVTPDQIISARRQFDAYGRALPAGVEKYRALAKEAWNDVQLNGAVNAATYYATPSAVDSLPSGLEPVTSTTGHRYFIDPKFRPIRTAIGVKPANPTVAQELLSGVEEMNTPIPDMRPVDEGLAVSSFAEVPQEAGGLAAIEGLVNGAIQQAQARFGTEAAPSETTNELGAVDREGYGSPLGAMGDRITSDFGVRDRPRTSLGLGSAFHQGTDLSLGPGASGYPAEAVSGGVVSNVYRSPSLGNTVEVQHPDGMTSRYSHLNEIGNVEVGQDIARGTPIGTVGNTGNSGASHLHFSMMDPQGNAVDPASVVDFNRENSLPTPTAADRRQPGQMVSDIANAAISPSLGDPNEALAASFNADRMNGQRVVGREALGDALRASKAAASMSEQSLDTLQQHADVARQTLSDQAAQSAQATQTASLGSPVGVDGQVTASTGVSAAADSAGIAPRSMADLAGQYAAYGAGKISPEQNLAADVYEQALSTKQARTPTYAMAQQTVDPNAGIDQSLGASSIVSPEALGDVEVDAYSQPSSAKRSVEEDDDVKQEQSMGPNKGRLSRSFANSKTMGSALGAVLGGILGGPVGAMALGGIGAKLGNLPAATRPRETPLEALFNIMTGKKQSEFPTAPEGGQGRDSRISYNDLNEYGREAYDKSRQVRDVVDNGKVGLF